MDAKKLLASGLQQILEEKEEALKKAEKEHEERGKQTDQLKRFVRQSQSDLLNPSAQKNDSDAEPPAASR